MVKNCRRQHCINACVMLTYALPILVSALSVYVIFAKTKTKW